MDGITSEEVALNEFLDRKRISAGADFTHTRLGQCPGAFYVPRDDMEELYKRYLAAMAAGAGLFITEKHRHISPVCIDVDLRFAPPLDVDGELMRSYNYNTIKDTILAHSAALADLIGPDKVDGKTFYVMEKPAPRYNAKQKLVKDGFHVMSPDIVTRTSIQHLARISAMKNDSLLNAFKTIGSLNDINDIIDEAVISRNNWFMYGSKKPDDAACYRVTSVIRVVFSPDGSISLDDSCAIEEPHILVRRLSLRNKYDEIPALDSVLEQVLAFEAKETSNSRKHSSERAILSKYPSGHTAKLVGGDLDNVRSMVKLLSLERLSGYESWMKVGWCLKNIDDSLLDAWIEASKRASDKYVDGECEKLWMRMKQGSLTIGTLYMWAKTDNPVAFKEIRSSSIHELVIDCLTGTHNDVARVVYAMFQHRFVCSGIRSHQWYEFSGHRWKTCDSGYALRKKLSIDVWREFSSAVGRFNQRALASPGHIEQQRLQDMTKQVLDIAQKLKMALFKDHVMKECAEMFYQDRFEEKLNSKINLIGFENGVYDLDADEFRDGRPDDYLTFSTRNDYVEYDENSQEIDGVQTYLAQVLTNPNVREYVIKTFASFLHGATHEQKFYIWTGTGSNSKSKLVELFEMGFGDYCCKLPVTLLTQKRAASNAATSEVAKSKGKRFACMQEPSEDEKMNVGLMKELSGGDTIMARCIYKEPIEFKPQFKMILLCNTLPDVPSDDGGTWRRIRVVEFTSKFVEKPSNSRNASEQEFPIDVKLSDKMKTWKEAFMSLLIKYYRRYVDEGISEPEEVLKCTTEYKKQNDFLADFVERNIVKDDISFLSLPQVYSEAKAFSREDGSVNKFPIRKVFDKYIENALKVKTTIINGTKGIKGFRYEDNPPPPPDHVVITNASDALEESTSATNESTSASDAFKCLVVDDNDFE